MNGFANGGLDEDAFGQKSALSAVKAFDAFPKTKPSYTQKTSTGGIWTIILISLSVLLTFTEVRRWYIGNTTHTFSVEKGVSHDLQINLDVVVAMKCEDLHINVQDASGDRILAGQTLDRAPTRWEQWGSNKKTHQLQDRMDLSGYPGGGEYREEDVHDYLGAAHRGKKKFSKTPKISRGTEADSCRIFGSMEGNKVQGDFHITARGHGYMELGQHLEHNTFNFSHHINELSFGPFYPSLTNPLDNTMATTDGNLYKFQYYLSVVPTIYTTDANALRRINPAEPPTAGKDGIDKHPLRSSSNTVFTNQYAVTEQSHPEQAVPGIFVKFDIEPILLTIAEEWGGVLALFVRLVNVVSGILVAGGWIFQLMEWSKEVSGRRKPRRADNTMGMLNGGPEEKRGL